jgi:hypothetical protein
VKGTLITTLLGRLLSQEVARTNASRAAMRMQHRRRQHDDVEAFLAAHHHDPAKRRS